MAAELPVFDTARDEIQALFWDYWKAQTPVLTGGAPAMVQWQGVDSGEAPTPNAPWARFDLRHTLGRQTTFGSTGHRRFLRKGLIQIQVFVPNSRGVGLSDAEKYSTIARDAFEGKGTPSGIWFRNASIQEIGVNEGWFQMNVSVEFVYDEMK